ncbi:MAG TPA: rRNA maturation RNase YbeY [Saprospiraceae bacterium]|nr:rRNA maturation RNase YbeY [Saprospiraceae bacterium]
MENIIVPSWPGIHRENPGIFFTSNDIDFELNDTEVLVDWIAGAIEEEGYQLDRIDYVFCSDEFLLDINRTHLNHEDYTDIITFPLEENPIAGEIYISVDRVKENAASFHISFEEELHRVMIHGILHLCGYDDHEEEDIQEIRAKEEAYLKQLDTG